MQKIKYLNAVEGGIETIEDTDYDLYNTGNVDPIIDNIEYIDEDGNEVSIEDVIIISEDELSNFESFKTDIAADILNAIGDCEIEGAYCTFVISTDHGPRRCLGSNCFVTKAEDSSN